MTASKYSVKNLEVYLQNADMAKPGNREKELELTRLVGVMDEAQAAKFAGMLDANSINGIDDILSLTEQLNEYTLLPEVYSDRTLGIYLAEHMDWGVPENMKPYLDHVYIGAEFHEKHDGAYTENGYVIRKDELPPELRIEQKKESEHIEVLKLELHTSDKAVCVSLPTNQRQFDALKSELEITDFAEASITSHIFSRVELQTAIPMECTTVEDCNELSLHIEDMLRHDGKLLTYLAALEVEQPQTLHEAINIAVDIGDYERVTEDNYDYGERRLRELGTLGADVYDEINGYMDYEAYGKDRLREDGVIPTEYGRVRRICEPFDSRGNMMTMGGM